MIRSPRCWFARGLLAVALLTPVAIRPLVAAPQLLPGVYGYGADRFSNTAGFGSNAVVLYVDPTLTDGTVADGTTAAAPTSLRNALNRTISGTPPRIIVFTKSGIVQLTSDLNLNKPFTTIAGQTAPAPGVAIHGAAFLVTTNNVLVQHLRLRPGDGWSPNVGTTNRDAMAISGTAVSNVVIDHCTFAWSLDEMVSTWSSWDNVTFNKCLFAEPMHASIHLDEDTFSSTGSLNVPQQAEALNPASNATLPAAPGHVSTINAPGVAVGGNDYQLVNSNGDADWIEYPLTIEPSGSARSGKHITIVGITGQDRAKFRVEVFNGGTLIYPTSAIPNPENVFDLYAGSAAPKTCITEQNLTASFTIPANATSLTVRLTVAGRHASATGWKLGIDQISITDGHGFGPLFGSGGSSGGKLSMTGCTLAHIVARGPWSFSRKFYYANNVNYNRRQFFLHFGHPDPANQLIPLHAAVLGNTFIEGKDMSPSPTIMSPIANSNTPPGSQLYIPVANNAYNFGDRSSPPAMVTTILTPPPTGTYGVTTDPTEPKTDGLAGVTALPPASAYEAALLGVGARPAERDSHESRLISEIRAGAAKTALATRDGSIKHTMASAGPVPTYPANTASWTLPANPHLDDASAGYPAGNGYTNIEEWLHGLSRSLESAIDAPTPKFDDFQDGIADGWVPDGGAWSMTTALNGSLVYRQSDDAQIAVRSVLNGTNWTDQLVEADANMISFTGTNRFMGVVARYRDPANYYYFILRTNNTWELKRLVDNVSLTLATGTVTVNTNTWYTLSLEVIGSTLKAYLNGVLLGSATDSSHPSGRIGLLQNFAHVQFDHVVADPNPGAVNAPLWLTATVAAAPNNINTINLAWDNVTNETGYKVERKRGVSGAWAQIGTPGIDAVTFSDTTCGAGTQYFYRVRATNGGGDSVFSAEANTSTAEVSSGRQAHWKFDENTGTSTADATPNGNAGTLATLPAGNPGPAWATGRIGSALNFDATDDVVTVGSPSTLDNLVTQGGGGMTITAWIKPTTVGEGGNPGRIVHKGTSTLPVAGWQFVTQATNSIAFAVDHGTTDLNRVAAANSLGTTLGVWKHVAVTWNGSATATNVRLYVDGVETAYGTTTNGGATRVDDATSSVSIGNDNSGVRTFNGALDDVRIYNRVLSTTELTAIRNAGM